VFGVRVDSGLSLRSNEPLRVIAALWRIFRDLFRDLAPGASDHSASGDEAAQADDLLDAAQDEDGLDATGL
jgi:hypothetical protein